MSVTGRGSEAGQGEADEDETFLQLDPKMSKLDNVKRGYLKAKNNEHKIRGMTTKKDSILSQQQRENENYKAKDGKVQDGSLLKVDNNKEIRRARGKFTKKDSLVLTEPRSSPEIN